MEHLKDSLEASEAILGRLGASDEGKMKHSILHVVFLIDFDWIKLPKIVENQ